MIIENGIVAKAITYLEKQTPQKPLRCKSASIQSVVVKFTILLFCSYVVVSLCVKGVVTPIAPAPVFEKWSA